MTDLTEYLCAIRREQKEACDLLPPASFQLWVKQGEARLNQLKKQIPTVSDSDDHPEVEEYDCIAGALDDIQQRRADLIWALAYDQAGDVNLMTQEEAGIYLILIGQAQKLRGLA